VVCDSGLVGRCIPTRAVHIDCVHRTLAEAGITGSIGNVGDALMESTVGLYKSKLIHQHPTFAGRAELERETASWVQWHNNTRLPLREAVEETGSHLGRVSNPPRRGGHLRGYRGLTPG
jgi:hypothetical protein